MKIIKWAISRIWFWYIRIRSGSQNNPPVYNIYPHMLEKFSTELNSTRHQEHSPYVPNWVKYYTFNQIIEIISVNMSQKYGRSREKRQTKRSNSTVDRWIFWWSPLHCSLLFAALPQVLSGVVPNSFFEIYMSKQNWIPHIFQPSPHLIFLN